MNDSADKKTINVAVVDYGMGNLFSIKHACENVGMQAKVTGDRKDLESSDIVILPGVGAFGDTMDVLNKLDLVEPIKDFAASGRPLIGICLGLQLFMTESYEFGRHKGLNLFEGTVERFDNPKYEDKILKVPHVGWNQIFAEKETVTSDEANTLCPGRWRNTPLLSTREGGYFYFVHSYYVKPLDENIVLTYTRYGDSLFCSSVMKDNIIGFQYHPERSGVAGLEIYRNIASLVK
ncbi:MAG: imidazole glycerol phosphate synthase subunit HisH [Deltaproteobacteria bacterium]|nr:imidazole glycerol phosphate synthase subunit HisH [Deltaproteobacteria bacterium]MBW2018601.1 imidazole glycerol phosphate synthase subunit HisH [Deltaproteobacteria bacterium]MBW2073867.1 imidazole glycerol phosphate synthase subunit HisH [Deltaproteobacteria bacterium]